MLRRVVLCLILPTLWSAVWHASDTGAVTIDPELQILLADKALDQVPVLLVFDDEITLLDDEFSGQRLDPDKRRREILKKLKDKARKKQFKAMAVIGGRAGADGLVRTGKIRQLYLAGAIVFSADAALAAALAGLDENAVLYHDRTYDLISGTTRPAGALQPQAPADDELAWNLSYVGVDRVWSELGYTGAGVVVGHVDTGAWLTHPDLVNRLWINPGEIPDNGLDDDGNGYIDDINGWDFGDGDNDPNDDSVGGGHGTHTAGTVVGDGSGGLRTGGAPGARLMICKAFAQDGGGTLGMMWAAQQYCVENGARIITMSLGVPGDVSVALMKADRLNTARIRDAGVVFFNSAGNDHLFYDPPLECNLTARSPSPWNPLPVPRSSTGGVITVGGLGYQSDEVYIHSSRGPVRWDNVDPWFDWPALIKPDVSAPAFGINSTVIPDGYSGDTWGGTSMACPLVASVAALMLEKNSSLSPTGVDSLLQLSALDLGPVGKDNDFGSGRLDAMAAVSATPGVRMPYLVRTGFLPDPDGDGFLDPGQACGAAVELRNSSTTTTAHGVTATLAVAPNPWVTVQDAGASFADLAPGLGSDNLQDPFILEIAADAPQGYEFTLLLTVTTAEGFRDTFDFTWFVGWPLWRTHQTGQLYATVTAQGSLGFLGQGSNEGDGIGLTGQPSSLFVGSLWAGTGPDYVCNRDYTGLGEGLEIPEWETTTDPSGRVQDLGPLNAQQNFFAAFSDAGHADPMPLTVTQASRAYGCLACDQFVVFEYRLTNDGLAPQPDFHAGLYCDFDLGDSMANGAGTDRNRNLAWISRAPDEGPYFGVFLLGDRATATNVTLVNNIRYVWSTSSISDADKFDLLSGVQGQAASTDGDDWSVLVSRHAPLAVGETAVLTWAVVHGETLPDLLVNADIANSVYDPIAAQGNDTPLPVTRLAQNRPNPFNPLTRIDFLIEEAGPVDLAVYDLGGRRVRMLVQDFREPGSYAAVWDGLDDGGSPLPSGSYVYRLRAGGNSWQRKMVLLK